MTREEEIKKIASTFAIDEVKDTCNPASKRGLLYVGFITGAEWADRTMIENACDWLYEFNRKQTNKMFGIVNTADVTINVAEFRKAMESGSSEIPNKCEKGGEE